MDLKHEITIQFYIKICILHAIYVCRFYKVIHTCSKPHACIYRLGFASNNHFLFFIFLLPKSLCEYVLVIILNI